MASQTDFKVTPADPEKLGVRANKKGVLFAVSVTGGQEASLLLYHTGEMEACQEIVLSEKDRVGEINAVFVEIPDRENYEYNYKIGGRIVPDPYARKVRVIQNSVTGKEEFRCALNINFLAKTRPLEIPYEDTILYKLHVKGITQNKPAGVKHPGTFQGLKERLPYFVQLGVNALVLMPVYEFLDGKKKKEKDCCYALDRDVKVLKSDEEQQEIKKNYWGYEEGLFFAPKASYCATDNGNREFAMLVDAMHQRGIECILEFFFEPDTDARFVTDVLRYWRIHFNIDGFHLVGDGPWVTAAATDPLLKKTKLFYTGFDTALICGEDKPYYKNLGVMNLEYEHAMRKFLKGDFDLSMDYVAELMRRNSEKCAFVNYFADQDGFTMNDMVTYSEKHNDDNGENNNDGSNQNYSWNCGEEGPSKKSGVKKLRMQQLRNAFLMLMTSQGTPMVYGGDEVLNTQNGNNNAWCQDNEIGWVTWGKTKASRQMQEFVREAILFRKLHPILHMAQPLRMRDFKNLGYPDLSYHSQIAWMRESGETKVGFGTLYYGAYGPDAKEELIYITYNMYWKTQEFALPDLPSGKQWILKADTSMETGFYADGAEKVIPESPEKAVPVPGRCVQIYMAVDKPAEEKKSKPSGKTVRKAADKTEMKEDSADITILEGIELTEKKSSEGSRS